MKSTDRAAWAIVAVTALLFGLGYALPWEWQSNFLSNLAARQRARALPEGGPVFRGPAQLPVPERYIVASRAAVTRRMAAPDWPGLSLEARRQAVLEVFLLSGADAAYWALPEARQRQVSEALVRAFLAPP